MAKDEQHAQIPPSAVLTFDIPEGLFRNGRIPDEKVLRKMDVGIEHGEGKKQGTDILEGGISHHWRQVSRALQQGGEHVDGCQGRPDTTCKVVDSIHGGKPLMLQRLHPVDHTQSQRDGKDENPNCRKFAHGTGVTSITGFILRHRMLAQIIGQPSPNHEE